MTSLLLRNVTLNGSRTHVLINKGVFADLKAPETAGADRVIDAHGMALLPPFYNTHTHQAMALLRGYGDDMALFTWLNDRIWRWKPNSRRTTFTWARSSPFSR